MKASISIETTTALEQLMTKVRAANAFAHKSRSALLEAIVAEFAESASSSQFESVSRRLTTAQGKRKSLVEALNAIATQGDEETLKTLEKTLAKLKHSVEKIMQNPA